MDYNIEKDERNYQIFIHHRGENRPPYVYRQSADQLKKDVCERLRMDEVEFNNEKDYAKEG